MERLLIIEDDAAFADYLRRGLTYEGYETRTAASAEEGLGTLRLAAPNAVILDVMLPGMDGIMACRAIRAAGYSVPILMLTARDGIGDRVAGLDSGADDYLPKPIQFDELLARLRTLRRRCPKPEGHSVLIAGAIWLDEERFIACRDGQLLPLTRAEFALMATLMRPPRCIRTREELITAVWGSDYEGGDKVLDVTISRLRAKLGPPDPIRTLHGVGYALSQTPESASRPPMDGS